AGYRETSSVPRAGGFDPQERLRDLDTEGIDVAVLFPSVGLYVSDATDPALVTALCRAYNDWLADYCRAAPARLIHIALLPLIDVPAAVRELERPAPHPAWDPRWACAAALGVPVTVHEGLSDWARPLGRARSENPAMLHVLS